MCVRACTRGVIEIILQSKSLIVMTCSTRNDIRPPSLTITAYYLKVQPKCLRQIPFLNILRSTEETI